MFLLGKQIGGLYNVRMHQQTLHRFRGERFSALKFANSCSILCKRLFLSNISLLMAFSLRVLVHGPSPHDAPDVAGVYSEHCDPHEDGEAAKVAAAVLSVAASDEGTETHSAKRLKLMVQ